MQGHGLVCNINVSWTTAAAGRLGVVEETRREKGRSGGGGVDNEG